MRYLAYLSIVFLLLLPTSDRTILADIPDSDPPPQISAGPVDCREVIAAILQAQGRIDFYRANPITEIEEAIVNGSDDAEVALVAAIAQNDPLCQSDTEKPQLD